MRLSSCVVVASLWLALAAGCGGRVVTHDEPSGTGGAGGSHAGGSGGSGGSGGIAGSGGVAGTGGVAGSGGVAGTGGVAGSGGVAGTGGGPPPQCVPGNGVTCVCSDGTVGVQTCAADGTNGECVCPGADEFSLLKWYQAAIVGMWEGKASTPWTPDYSVRFEFTADGHYSAHNLDPNASNPALYYGVDDDSPEKTYELIDVTANKMAVGRIVVWFGPGSTALDDIKQMQISSDLKLLDFEVWHQVTYGPLVYALHRVPK